MHTSGQVFIGCGRISSYQALSWVIYLPIPIPCNLVGRDVYKILFVLKNVNTKMIILIFILFNSLFILNKMLGKKLYQTWLKQLENGGIWALFHLFFFKVSTFICEISNDTIRFWNNLKLDFYILNIEWPNQYPWKKTNNKYFLFFFPFCTSLFVVILYAPFLGVLMVEV